MNTPKTVKRNQREKRRHSAHKERRTPGGVFFLGCTNDEVAVAFAKAMTNWPFVEDEMVAVMRSLLGGVDEEIASSVFHALIAQNTRIPVMRSLLEDTRANKDKPEAYDEILDEFKRLNAIRNQYAHWLWYTHRETGDVYISTSKQGGVRGLAFGEKVTADSLSQFEKDCDILVDRIMKIVGFGSAPFPETPQKAPRRPNRRE